MVERKESALLALSTFERWSNYLLVTTVGALGWIGSDQVTFASKLVESMAVWFLGLSIIFGIFTLGLLPLLAEQLEDRKSIYEVPIRFSLFGVDWTLYLTQVCRPQHLLFISGIALFCFGATTNPWSGVVIAYAAITYGFLSIPRRSRRPAGRG